MVGVGCVSGCVCVLALWCKCAMPPPSSSPLTCIAIGSWVAGDDAAHTLSSPLVSVPGLRRRFEPAMIESWPNRSVFLQLVSGTSASGGNSALEAKGMPPSTMGCISLLSVESPAAFLCGGDAIDALDAPFGDVGMTWPPALCRGWSDGGCSPRSRLCRARVGFSLCGSMVWGSSDIVGSRVTSFVASPERSSGGGGGDGDAFSFFTKRLFRQR